MEVTLLQIKAGFLQPSLCPRFVFQVTEQKLSWVFKRKENKPTAHCSIRGRGEQIGKMAGSNFSDPSPPPPASKQGRRESIAEMTSIDLNEISDGCTDSI